MYGLLSVLSRTNQFREQRGFREQETQYYRSVSIRLSVPIDDVLVMKRHCTKLFNDLLKVGFNDKKMAFV